MIKTNLSSAAKDRTGDAGTGREKDSTSANRWRILMIDDDASFLASMSSLLEDSGCQVITAPNGTKGVEVYRHKSDQIDVVLLDYLMPGMDGLQAYHWLQRINPTVKVILLSGAEALRLRQFYSHHPVAGCLRKPAFVQDVLQAIQQAAGSTQPPSAREENRPADETIPAHRPEPVPVKVEQPTQPVQAEICQPDPQTQARLQQLTADLEQSKSELIAAHRKFADEAARRSDAVQSLQRVLAEKKQLEDQLLTLRNQLCTLEKQLAKKAKASPKVPTRRAKRKTKASPPSRPAATKSKRTPGTSAMPV
jgi:CheY-like chemotaxis protein